MNWRALLLLLAVGMALAAAEAPFRILPPFYRTWWAWLSYLAALGILGYFFTHGICPDCSRELYPEMAGD